MDYKSNMEQLISGLAENEAALIYTPVNRRYLTGFTSSLGYLLVSPKNQTLLVDGRYFEAAGNCVTSANVYLLRKLSQQLKTFANAYGVTKLLVEDEISVGTALAVKDAVGCELEAHRLSSVMGRLRKIKTDDELQKIIAAQRIAEKAFGELMNFIKSGITEKRLATQLEYLMKLYGADGISFDTVAVSGEKSSLPHGVPGEREVKPGDFITFDFGAVVDGYHSDMTRTVAVEYASERMKEVYETVLMAEKAGEDAAFAGKCCADVDMAARTVIVDAGYGQYFAHSTGHGVGLEIHEGPTLSKNCAETLMPGMVVTCEPGIYIPGEFGVRTEDMLFIRENGPENLTKFKKELIIV